MKYTKQNKEASREIHSTLYSALLQMPACTQAVANYGQVRLLVWWTTESLITPKCCQNDDQASSSSSEA